MEIVARLSIIFNDICVDIYSSLNIKSLYIASMCDMNFSTFAFAKNLSSPNPLWYNIKDIA